MQQNSLSRGIIVCKLNGHMKAEIEAACATVGIMATKATKSSIHIGNNLILVTKANQKELERRIRLFVDEQPISFLLCYNQNSISESRLEVEKFINDILSKYGIKTLFYKSLY